MSKIDEAIKSVYPKYNSSLDFYKKIYETITKKSGGRSESNSEKRMEEINKLIILKNEFKIDIKNNCFTDEIIDSTYILRLDEFMKLMDIAPVKK